MSQSVLAIGESSIRQLDGMYSLNDLHRASGGQSKTRPNQFMRLDTTQALIAEIETAQMCAVKTTEGRKGGTYVCRELVYAYAMWISAKFSLEVIRAFDALKTAPPPTLDIAAMMRERLRDPKLPVTNEIQSAINRKAWALSHDAYELLREHIARRVACNAEFGNPRYLDEAAAQAAIAETTLDMALTPRIYSRLDSYMRLFEALAHAANENAETLRKEIDKTLNMGRNQHG